MALKVQEVNAQKIVRLFYDFEQRYSELRINPPKNSNEKEQLVLKLFGDAVDGGFLISAQDVAREFGVSKTGIEKFRPAAISVLKDPARWNEGDVTISGRERVDNEWDYRTYLPELASIFSFTRGEVVELATKFVQDVLESDYGHALKIAKQNDITEKVPEIAESIFGGLSKYLYPRPEDADSWKVIKDWSKIPLYLEITDSKLEHWTERGVPIPAESTHIQVDDTSVDLNRKSTILLFLNAKEVSNRIETSEIGPETAIAMSAAVVVMISMPYGQNYTEIVVPLEKALDEGNGVCRHKAAAVAAILIKFKQEGMLDGEITYNHNHPPSMENGHAWIEYINTAGNKLIIDAAQNWIGFHNPLTGQYTGLRMTDLNTWESAAPNWDYNYTEDLKQVRR